MRIVFSWCSKNDFLKKWIVPSHFPPKQWSVQISRIFEIQLLTAQLSRANHRWPARGQQWQPQYWFLGCILVILRYSSRGGGNFPLSLRTKKGCDVTIYKHTRASLWRKIACVACCHNPMNLCPEIWSWCCATEPFVFNKDDYFWLNEPFTYFRPKKVRAICWPPLG